MIDVEQWKRLSALIDEAWALDGDARQVWLDRLAAREPALAARVRAALDAEPETDDEAVPVTDRTGFDRELGQALRAPADARPAVDLAGQRLGPWRLDAKIGEGGMGQVWRAHRDDGLYKGQAAIKLLRSDLGHTALAARFARERALLARLHHPAIARLLDAGVASDGNGPLAGQAYLVLEMAEGQALNDHVRRHAPQLAARVRLLMRVAEAVEYAHARLVVHRDLKPSNVLVAPDGAPKLLDFGIAGMLDEDPEATHGELTRMTGRGLTLGYAAPEQITGDSIGTPADVFSLGVMLYELCTGALPFGRRHATRAAFERAVLHDTPRRPLLAWQQGDEADATAGDDSGPGRPADGAAMRGDLEAIIGKALRKDAADRHPSARALIDDLQAWLDHRPVSARRDNWRHNARLWLRRNALLAAGLALVFVSLAAGLGASLWQRSLALSAARQSDEVTAYLEELLSSADPDQHGGSWPTVVQLLDKSRAELPARFADSPDTRLRVLRVLLGSYRRMNRLDVAVPLAQELLVLAQQRRGEADPLTLEARFELAHSHHLVGQCDRGLAVIEPALPLVRALPVEQLDALTLPAVSLYGLCLRQQGRFDEAERVLDEERRLIDRLPPGSKWIYGYYNHLSALRQSQGRLRDALEAVRRTEPLWQSTEPEDQREILTQQRNLLQLQIRLAEHHRIEERLAELIGRIDALMGPGAQLGIQARNDLARYRLEVGRYRAAAEQAEATLAQVRQAGVQRAVVLLPVRARALVARTQAGVRATAGLQVEARSLFVEAQAQAAELGGQRPEVLLAVARSALALDDAELAAQALDAMQADASLNLEPGPRQDLPLAARKWQLDGQLARLRGDLPASRRLLAARLEELGRSTERRQVTAWSVALDLAYTLVLAGAPEAADALDGAASRRPESIPAEHPLDLAARYLRERLVAGTDDAPAVLAARTALWQAQRRDSPDAGNRPPPGAPFKGAMGGVLF